MTTMTEENEEKENEDQITAEQEHKSMTGIQEQDRKRTAG